MRDLTNVMSSDLQKWSETEGKGRKMRDFEYFHLKGYGYAAGHTSLEFFRTDGQQEDISGTPGTTTNISNMVTSGKFDEPFLLTAISVLFLPYSTTQASQILDTLNVLRSGRLELEINNTPVFWRAPIGRCGSPLAFKGFAATNSGTHLGVYNMLQPHKFNPPIFCKEGITVKTTMYWTTAVTLADTNSLIGVYLHGAKFFKE